MAVRLPLLAIGAFFFAMCIFLLLSGVDETIEDEEYVHPCPYADVLGLDANSVNPHGSAHGPAGGHAADHLPPIFHEHAQDDHLEQHTPQVSRAPVSRPPRKDVPPQEEIPPEAESHNARSDFDTSPPYPHKMEL